VRDKVIASLESLFGDRDVDIAALGDGDRLDELLEWDSMDVVDLGMEFKRRHGVNLPEDLEQIATVGRLVGLLSA
jgi:acyl carrier protein